MRRVDSSIVGVEAPEVVKAQRDAFAAREVRRGTAALGSAAGRLRDRGAEDREAFFAVNCGGNKLASEERGIREGIYLRGCSIGRRLIVPRDGARSRRYLLDRWSAARGLHLARGRARRGSRVGR